jgi:hypothetical protein
MSQTWEIARLRGVVRVGGKPSPFPASWDETGRPGQPSAPMPPAPGGARPPRGFKA